MSRHSKDMYVTMTKFHYSLDSTVQHCTTVNYVQCRVMISYDCPGKPGTSFAPKHPKRLDHGSLSWSKQNTCSDLSFCCWFFSCHPNSQCISVNTQQSLINNKGVKPSINQFAWLWYRAIHTILSHPHPTKICEQTFTEAFFLRFVKVSKSLPLSEPTFCAPISKPTTHDMKNPVKAIFWQFDTHKRVIIRGSWGITSYGDDCFLVCLVCISSWGRWTLQRSRWAQPYRFLFPEWSWQTFHWTCCCMFATGILTWIFLNIVHQFSRLGLLGTMAQVLGLADVRYKQE